MPILERLISTIAPHECLGCAVENTLLCRSCSSIHLNTPPERCYRCRAVSDGFKTCMKCRKTSKLGYVWVGSEYVNLAETLVKKLKFENVRAASGSMAEHLIRVLPELPDNIIITHVPTATSRVRQRGYDQAQLLARDLARNTGKPDMRLLARSGQTRQVGTKRTQRIRQVEQAFRVRYPTLVRGAHIILVDDVLTTGATLENAAKTLKATGAKKVDAIVFAQA